MVRILTFASLLVVLLGGSLVSARSFSEKSVDAEEPKSVEEAEELLELIDPGLAELSVRDEIDDTDLDEKLPDGEVETDSRVEEIPTEDRELALARARGNFIKRPNGRKNDAKGPLKRHKAKAAKKEKEGKKPKKAKGKKRKDKEDEEDEEEENGLRAIKKLTRKIITLLMKPEVKPWMLKGLKDNLEKSYEINENIAGGKLFSEGKVKFDKNGKKGFKIATDSFSTYKVGASSGKDISLLDLLKP
jgi:hypothetical protein